jgi:MerR family transcriptional regulator, light-induced transcriptional regulator
MHGQEPRVQPPALDAFSDLPLFNTKAVVHQTGVPAPTLRAWERRYGILNPRRGENDYRLYSERDIITVTWLRERVQTGMTISQAIALLKSLEPARRRARRSARVTHPNIQGNGHGNGHTGVTGAPAATLSRFSLDEIQATLVHQFANLDEFAASRTIAQTLSVHAIEDVCLYLLEPVLDEIGRLWSENIIDVAIEHFSANVIRGQLESLFRGAGDSMSGPVVLVGCAPGELHEIGALMLALFLRRAGLHVAYLGQTVETEGLAHIVATLHPAAIVLSASLRDHVDGLIAVGRRLAELSEPRPLFAFGGRAFKANPDLGTRVPGLYLGTDARGAVSEIRKRFSA